MSEWLTRFKGDCDNMTWPTVAASAASEWLTRFKGDCDTWKKTAKTVVPTISLNDWPDLKGIATWLMVLLFIAYQINSLNDWPDLKGIATTGTNNYCYSFFFSSEWLTRFKGDCDMFDQIFFCQSRFLCLNDWPDLKGIATVLWYHLLLVCTFVSEWLTRFKGDCDNW